MSEDYRYEPPPIPSLPNKPLKQKHQRSPDELNRADARIALALAGVVIVGSAAHSGIENLAEMVFHTTVGWIVIGILYAISRLSRD